MVSLSERHRALVQFLVLFAVAALVRLVLSARYYGWEEGDYGNLMMIQEVLDSQFTWFRSTHMPGWYSLGALARLVESDARASALGMTLLFSSLNVAVAALLARKLFSPATAWLVGLWLVVQPEMALYGASTLRSPVFVSLAFLGMALLVWGARDRAFGLTAAAFLVRMEGFFLFYGPALWAWFRDQGRRLGTLLVPIALLLGVVVGWQAYISLVQERCLGVEFDLQDLHRCWGTVFFLGPFGVNLAPDVHGAERIDLFAWAAQGVGTSWDLLSWTLPRKLGWVVLALSLLGAISVWRGHGRPGARAVVVYAFFALGGWLFEGFLAHHDPNHNLYWVWLLPAIPFLVLLAAAGWNVVDRRLRHAPALLRPAVFFVVLLAPLPQFAAEAGYQMERAERWYRPQLELSRWMEQSLEPGTGVLVSSIPEVWLKRQPGPLRVYSWWLLPDRVRVSPEEEMKLAGPGSDLEQQILTRPGTVRWDDRPERVQGLYLDRVGRFLRDEGIHYLVWFEEDWTESLTIAPFLAAGEAVQAGPVTITPVDQTPPIAEGGYGWILYVVTTPDDPRRRVPPSYGSGERGPGWG